MYMEEKQASPACIMCVSDNKGFSPWGEAVSRRLTDEG